MDCAWWVGVVLEVVAPVVASSPMSHVTAAPSDSDPESRVLLGGIPWSVYVALRDSIASGAVKMTYLEGDLEIMSPSRRHEVENTMLGRLLELFALEKDIPLYGYGSMTMRKKLKKRGLEPDKCYCRDFDEERPQLAIEVVISSPLLDKLEVYRGLGIGEVWTLRDGRI